MEIQLKNNTLTLLAEKAVWWASRHTLIISDLHIGKIAHFRKAGIAVPQQALFNNFMRLDALMCNHPVRCIIFTGDLFHSDVNEEWEHFCDWRKRYPDVAMHIVLGNHDRLPNSFCTDYNMEIHQKEYFLHPFTFVHKPKQTIAADEYVLCGHVHPVIKLVGKANQEYKFPCFHIGKQQGILPSFGYFTGGYRVRPQAGDTIIAVVGDTLIELPDL